MENEQTNVQNPTTTDSEWAKDVPFTNLDKEIREKKEASMDAFKSLEESAKIGSSVNAEDSLENTDVQKDKKRQKSVPKKGRKTFTVCLLVYLAVLSGTIAFLLYRFYVFLEDYENVYNESLPYHEMDDFMETFYANDYASVKDNITNQPEISEFESDENVINYISVLMANKEAEYFEASDSTERNPKYSITADGYIVGDVTFKESEAKRKYDLPIYELSDFEFYTDPSYCAFIKIPDNCTVFINDVKVNSDYIIRTDSNDSENEYFKGFDTVPLTEYYMVDNLYEKPQIKVTNSFGMEFEPTLNTETGIYEADYVAPKEVEDEMLEFAKKSVDTYAKVMSRELNSGALDSIFIKGHPFVKAIKSNESQFEWFPNHSTQGTDDTIREFIPYTENAFYVEIEHVQHTLKYGVVPTDIPLLAEIYYVKEDGDWKISTINFIYD